jgi:hypothetical protein
VTAYPDQDGNILFEVHGRAALHDRWRSGKRIELATAPNQKPLTVGSGHGEKEVYTLAFKLKIKLPASALSPAGQPTFNVTIPEDALTGMAPEAEIVALLIEDD